MKERLKQNSKGEFWFLKRKEFDRWRYYRSYYLGTLEGKMHNFGLSSPPPKSLGAGNLFCGVLFCFVCF